MNKYICVVSFFFIKYIHVIEILIHYPFSYPEIVISIVYIYVYLLFYLYVYLYTKIKYSLVSVCQSIIIISLHDY